MSTAEAKCDRCGKIVYGLERCTVDAIDGRIWHQHCFKCQVCNSTIPKGKGEGYNELGVVFCKYHYPKLTPSLMAEWLRRLGRNAEADAYERRMQDELDQKRRDEEARRKAAEDARRAAEEAARQRAAEELARREALRPSPVVLPSSVDAGHPTLRTLAEQGAIVKAADKAVRDERGIPKELSPKIQDDLEKAAKFGAMCKELSAGPNRSVAGILSKGANDMDRATKDLADKGNRYFQNYLEPRQPERDAIDSVTRDIDNIVDAVLAELIPGHLRAPQSSYPASKGIPSALSLRDQGELVKKADAQLRSDLGNQTPKRIAADAQDSADKGATFADMARKYGSGANPAVRALMTDGANEMDTATRDLVRDTDNHLENPISSTEDPVRGDTTKMDNIVDRLLAELFPAALVYPAHLSDAALGPVTPDDLRKQGELVKVADKKVRDDLGNVTPRQVADDAGDAVRKAGKFADIAAKLGKETPNRALADLLRNGAADVDRAKDNVVDRANDVLRNPDSPAAEKALAEATRIVDDLVDKILGDAAPRAVVMPSHQRVNANPGDLHAQAARVKAADKKVRDDIPYVAPKVLTDVVNDSAKEAVLFGDMADNVAEKSANPALANAIRKGTEKLGDAVRDLVDGTNKFIDPSTKTSEAAVTDPTKAIDRAVDEIMGEIFPPPIQRPVGSYNLSNVTPEDLRRQGALVKAADSKIRDDMDHVTPKELGKDATDAAEKADKFGEMAKALANNIPNRGLADLLSQGGRDVDNAKDKLVDLTNDYLKNPESPAAKKAVADATKALDDLVDRILGDVSPSQVKYPTSSPRNANPNDLRDQAARVKAADKKIRDDIPFAPPKTVADETQDAADKAQVFGDMANDVGNKSTNPALRDIIRNGVNDLGDGIRDLVDGANAFLDPAMKAPATRVTNPTTKIDDAVDAIMGEIFPAPVSPLFGLDAIGDVTPDDLKRQGAEVKRADDKVRNDTDKVTPKNLGKEAADAAEKADKFGRMAAKLGDKLPNKGLGDVLKRGAGDMDKAKDKLVDATNNYLANPESAPTKKALADATRVIDDLVDKILDDAAPKKLVLMPDHSHVGNVKPDDLLEQCQKVKREDAKTRDDLGRVAPIPFANQVQKNADEAGKLAGMAKKLGPAAPTPELRRALEEGAEDLGHGIKDLVNSANNVIQNPSGGSEPEVERATRKIDDIVDKMMGNLQRYKDEEDRLRREKEAADEAERQRRLAEEMAARARLAGFNPKSRACHTCQDLIPAGEKYVAISELGKKGINAFR